MLAMLFATYIIKGLWTYEKVPAELQPDVKAILIAEGRDNLILGRK